MTNPDRAAHGDQNKGVIASTLLAITSFVLLGLIQKYQAELARFPDTAIKAVTGALGASMIASICSLLSYLRILLRARLIPLHDGVDTNVQDRDAAEEVSRASIRVPVPEPQAEYYRNLASEWKAKFDSVRSEAVRRLGDANSRIALHLREATEANELNAALRSALTCGIFMAIASGITTYLLKPIPLVEKLNHHIQGLAAAYSLVAFIYGFGAGLSRQPPNHSIAIRVGGLGALYANSVSVIINLPYSWDSLFSVSSAPKIGVVPVGFFIVFTRLLVLPAVSVLACWLGCMVAIPFRASK